MPSNREYWYDGELVRVIDGDTIFAEIDLGFTVKVSLPVRLAHINAPEHNTTEGTAATTYLTGLITNKKLLFKTYKPKDKYGRYLAEIYIDGTQVNKQMIDAGHAVAYEGGAR